MTLKGTTRGWFGTLKPKSIDSFEELAKQFLTQFMPSRRRRRPATYLVIVKQKEDKNLKTYLTPFNKKRLTTDDHDEKNFPLYPLRLNMATKSLYGRASKKDSFQP